MADSLRQYKALKCEQKKWLTWHVADTTRTIHDPINVQTFFIIWDFITRCNAWMLKDVIESATLWLTVC